MDNPGRCLHWFETTIGGDRSAGCAGGGLGTRAGIPSVPNVLARVDCYSTLREVARGLGPDLLYTSSTGELHKQGFIGGWSSP